MIIGPIALLRTKNSSLMQLEEKPSYSISLFGEISVRTKNRDILKFLTLS